MGTAAALHRVRRADVVAFLDFDQELSAPRYRAAEEALALLSRASRLVGGRDGRVLIQTFQPDHEVVRAALGADPTPVAVAEAERRVVLSMPPAVTAVTIGGAAGPQFTEAVLAGAAEVGLDVTADELAVADRRSWLLRAHDRDALLDLLAGTVRPPGGLRLHVDPMRVRR
ncbi:MAG: hypothetical protein R2698_13355 [Microthrixaceae bacterium]